MICVYADCVRRCRCVIGVGDVVSNGRLRYQCVCVHRCVALDVLGCFRSW